MRAAVCKAYQRIVLETVPVPEPKEGEVLVQVKSTGLCGSDLHGYQGTHPMIKWPVILGHEASGVIAECGPGVTDRHEGEAVSVEPLFTCSRCPACLSGSYHLCRDLKFAGHQLPGSLAEYFIAESRFAHRKPDNVSFEEAALAEPASSPLHAVERCRIGLGDFVAILGCGITGMLLAQYALAKGAEVLVTDPVDFKLDLAGSFGVHHTVNPARESAVQRILDLTGSVGADVVFEAAGKPETMLDTTAAVKRGGTVVLIGYTGREREPFDLTAVTLKELNVLGSLAFCRDFPAALKMMSMGKIRVKPLITQTISLDEVEKGLEMMRDLKTEVLKVIVRH
jgi:L-iditol 2-dehydrogenase